MPPGYLATVLIIGACVALLLARPRPQSRVGSVSYFASLLVNEQPHWYAALLAAITVLGVTQGEISSTGWIVVALAGAVFAGLLVLLVRAFPSRAALRTAVSRLDENAVRRLAGKRSYLVALLAPVPLGWALARRTRNIAYGPAGKANRLDVYRPRRSEATGPTLIYLHGGRFRMGDKRRESQLMKYRLARRGWVVISANYRLNPEGKFPDFLIDLKRVIAWARSEGLAFGLDPDRILLAGSSAGAHISAMAALTPNRPDLQPGFEDAETSVSGVIGLYGYYGRLNVSGPAAEAIPSSPIDLVHPDAPPFLLIDAGHDSVIGPETTKQLAHGLGDAGAQAARVELPGAEHTFDLLRSVRVVNTIDAIEDFAGLACGQSR